MARKKRPKKVKSPPITGAGYLKKRNWLEDDPREQVIEVVEGCVEYRPDPYKPMCAPQKYITEIGRQVVRRMAARGYSKQLIAASLGLSLGRFNTLQTEDDALKECFNVGLSGLENVLTSNLLRMAENGNVIAAIYLTKTRLGWRDDGGNVESRPNVVIMLPATMSKEAYKQMLDAGVTPMMLPQPEGEKQPEEQRMVDRQPLMFTTQGQEVPKP
jgi:hypothetical protein